MINTQLIELKSKLKYYDAMYCDEKKNKMQ